jgi:WD40 repeat protein
MRFRILRHARWIIGVLFVCLMLAGCAAATQVAPTPTTSLLDGDPINWWLTGWTLSEDGQFISVTYGYENSVQRTYGMPLLEEVTDETALAELSFPDSLTWRRRVFVDTYPSPDAAMIAIFESYDAHPGSLFTLHIEDAAGHTLHEFDPEQYSIHTVQVPSSVAWSPDSAYVAWASEDGQIWIWNTSDWHLEERFFAERIAITYLAWAPDGTRIASGDWDGNIRIWDFSTGKAIQLIEGAQESGSSIYNITWVSDTILLATDTYNLVLWDLEIDNVNSVRLTR